MLPILPLTLSPLPFCLHSLVWHQVLSRISHASAVSPPSKLRMTRYQWLWLTCCKTFTSIEAAPRSTQGRSNVSTAHFVSFLCYSFLLLCLLNFTSEPNVISTKVFETRHSWEHHCIFLRVLKKNPITILCLFLVYMLLVDYLCILWEGTVTDFTTYINKVVALVSSSE